MIIPLNCTWIDANLNKSDTCDFGYDYKRQLTNTYKILEPKVLLSRSIIRWPKNLEYILKPDINWFELYINFSIIMNGSFPSDI